MALQFLPFHSQNSSCQNLRVGIIAGQYLTPMIVRALSRGASLSRVPSHPAADGPTVSFAKLSASPALIAAARARLCDARWQLSAPSCAALISGTRASALERSV